MVPRLDRRHLQHRLSRLRQDECALLSTLVALCADHGEPSEIDAAFGEVLVTNSKLCWLIDHGEAALKPERRETNLILAHKTHEVRYEPLGVVAALVSWNYPCVPLSSRSSIA